LVQNTLVALRSVWGGTACNGRAGRRFCCTLSLLWHCCGRSCYYARACAGHIKAFPAPPALPCLPLPAFCLHSALAFTCTGRTYAASCSLLHSLYIFLRPALSFFLQRTAPCKPMPPNIPPANAACGVLGYVVGSAALRGTGGWMLCCTFHSAAPFPLRSLQRFLQETGGRRR